MSKNNPDKKDFCALNGAASPSQVVVHIGSYSLKNRTIAEL